MGHPKKTYECKQCKKTFTKYMQFRKHVKIHALPSSFKCARCEKHFNTAVKLNAHISSEHVKTEPINCNMCGKSFEDENTFKDHMETHLIQDNFMCDICGKSFRFLNTLKCHSVIHCEEYPCNTCQKSFTTSSALAKHQDIHPECKENMRNSVETSMKKKNSIKDLIDKPIVDFTHTNITNRNSYSNICILPLNSDFKANMANDFTTCVQSTKITAEKTDKNKESNASLITINSDTKSSLYTYSEANIQKNDFSKTYPVGKHKRRVNSTKNSVKSSLGIRNKDSNSKENFKFLKCNIQENDSTLCLINESEIRIDSSETVKNSGMLKNTMPTVSSVEGSKFPYSRFTNQKNDLIIYSVKEETDVEMVKESDPENTSVVVNSVKHANQNSCEISLWCHMCNYDLKTAEKFKDHVIEHRNAVSNKSIRGNIFDSCNTKNNSGEVNPIKLPRCDFDTVEDFRNHIINIHKIPNCDKLDTNHNKLLQNSSLNSSKHFNTYLKKKSSPVNETKIKIDSSTGKNSGMQKNTMPIYSIFKGDTGIKMIEKRDPENTSTILNSVKHLFKKCDDTSFWCHLCSFDLNSAENFRDHIIEHRNTDCYEPESDSTVSSNVSRKHILPLEAYEDCLLKFDIESPNYILWLRYFIKKCIEQSLPYPKKMVQQIAAVIDDISLSIYLAKPTELLKIKEKAPSITLLRKVLGRIMKTHVEYVLASEKNTDED